MSVHEFHLTGYARSTSAHHPPRGTCDTILPRGGGKEAQPLAFVVQQTDQDDSKHPTPLGTASSPEVSHLEREAQDLLTALQAQIQRRSGRSNAFSILAASPQQELMCSVRPAAEGGTHDVFAADGSLIARITRTPGRMLPWPRRAKWTVQLSPGSTFFTGRKGTWYAWLAFVILSPLWLVAFALALVISLLGDGDSDWLLWDPPSRTKWRGENRWGLDYRGVSGTYRRDAITLDTRVAYAQAVLHSWGGR